MNITLVGLSFFSMLPGEHALLEVNSFGAHRHEAIGLWHARVAACNPVANTTGNPNRLPRWEVKVTPDDAGLLRYADVDPLAFFRSAHTHHVYPIACQQLFGRIAELEQTVARLNVQLGVLERIASSGATVEAIERLREVLVSELRALGERSRTRGGLPEA